MQRFTDPAAAIHVAAGETFALALAGNPSTGYTWQASVDPRYLELGSQEFEPQGQGVGAGGFEVFQLRALAAGHSEIACEYRRPWDREALKTTKFRVVIQ
jgi:predicted secreted protein